MGNNWSKLYISSVCCLEMWDLTDLVFAWLVIPGLADLLTNFSDKFNDTHYSCLPMSNGLRCAISWWRMFFFLPMLSQLFAMVIKLSCTQPLFICFPNFLLAHAFLAFLCCPWLVKIKSWVWFRLKFPNFSSSTSISSRQSYSPRDYFIVDAILPQGNIYI